MSRYMEKLKKKRFTPTNNIDKYQKQANKIKHDNIYNYKYQYFTATPHGMRSDDEKNHKYGTKRDGYEQLRLDEKNISVSHAGVVSLRTITDRDRNNAVIGYITEEKLSDSGWKDEISKLADECFNELCSELDVKDEESFRYFLFNDLGLFKDYELELQSKLDKMVHVYNEYNNDEEFRAFIDKIIG